MVPARLIDGDKAIPRVAYRQDQALLPIGSAITKPLGRTPLWPTNHRRRGSAKTRSLVRPKGPFLRPDLARPPTVAGRGKEHRRRPAIAGAQRPCGGLSLRSRSLQEGSMLDAVNNVLGNDT